MMKSKKLYTSIKSFGVLKGIIFYLCHRHTHRIICFKTRKNRRFPYNIKIRTNTSDLQCLRQVIIDQEYNINIKPKPKVIIDAGANIGLSSVYLAEKYPDAKIYAIEPDSSNFIQLLENVAKYKNVIPINAGLWHKSCMLNVYDCGLGEWGIQVSDKEMEGKKLSEIHAISIDDLIKKYNLKNIDFLKLDIEGSEKNVLNNSNTWIDKVNTMAVETHDRMIDGCTDALMEIAKNFDKKQVRKETTFLFKS